MVMLLSRSLKQLFSRRTVLILLAIALTSVLFSILSYAYSSFNSEHIASIALENMETQSVVQAYDLSKSLEGRLSAVQSNLKVMADVIALHHGNDAANVTLSHTLISSAEATTDPLTDTYFLIDKNGALIWSNGFENKDTFNQYYGNDRSDRPYFFIPKEKHTAYFSVLRGSVDGVPRIFMSYPIMSPSDGGNTVGNGTVVGRTFEGVVVASFNLESLGRDLNAQLAPGTRGMVSLMDKNGTILYTPNNTLLGKNYFSPDVQSFIFPQYVSSDQKDSFNSMLVDSLAGHSGLGHISISGVPHIIAYHPVMVNTGNSDQREHALELHLLIPQTFASDIGSLIDQQRVFSTIVPAAIGGVAIVFALFVLRWNKSLQSAVKERTAELAAANEQLKAHDKMQSEFINIAAHELRTPIQPIIGMIDILKYRLGSKQKIDITEQQLTLMDRNAKRLQKLSSEILDATRIEAGTLQLERELIDINENVQSIVADAENWIPKGKSIDIQYRPIVDDLGNPIPTLVMGDKLRIFQVLSNLVRNAINFSLDDGTITIKIGKEEDGGDNNNNNNGGRFVVISVKDQGIGISQEMLPKLFQKFSPDKEMGGTGLGLFIAKNIIEAHGGRIWAENNNSDNKDDDNKIGDKNINGSVSHDRRKKGATFTFTLPLIR